MSLFTCLASHTKGHLELLYGRDQVNPRKHKHTILPNDKAVDFRWIHLPANNMAWIEFLLTKLFIEEGGSDIEGFKALEKSFSHQHRGQQSHSHFMRPLCQSTPRAPKGPSAAEEPESSSDQGPPTIVIHQASEGSSTPKRSSGKNAVAREESWDVFRTPSRDGQTKGGQKEKNKGKKESHPKGSKSPKLGSEPSYSGKDNKKPSRPNDDPRPHSPSSPGRRENSNPKGNIFTFMPYLHFESNNKRQEMQEAIERAENLRSPLCPPLGKAKTYDEMLIRAHLATSTASLHVRRTLDQSFYHNIDTQSRDQDQVVYRYQLRGTSIEDSEVDPKIVMVDQLWMWVLGPNLIVTSFPQRWQQPKNDPLNVLDNVIEDINSKTREPVKSVYDLAMTITSRCTGVFDRHRMGMGDEEYQFLDMFESSIGSATDRETMLFKEFNSASAQASAWLQHHRKPARFSRYLSNSEKELAEIQERTEKALLGPEEFTRGPMFVDKLLDIGQETDLLAETKDIRDELNMISKVLDDQTSVLPDLLDCILDIYQSSNPRISQSDVKKRARDQLKTIEMHLKDIERMDKQAIRIYESITDMLDLKQKHANAFEARFARDSAVGTQRQSQTIMVFTIVTIVFLPLSFIAAFFAINVREFPRDQSSGNTSLPLAYVSKYMFGIGFAVTIPLIVVALSLNDIGEAWTHLKYHVRTKWCTRWEPKGHSRGGGGRRNDEWEIGGGGGLDVLRIQQALSLAKSGRASYETGPEWIRGERISMNANRPGTGGSRFSRAMEREGEMVGTTGFREIRRRDVERGLGLGLGLGLGPGRERAMAVGI